MNAVLWGNGIGNFVMTTPFIQNLKNPTIFIPKADPRREAIESISPFPVKIFEHEDDFSRYDKVYQMWCSPKIDGKNVVRQPKPRLHDWNCGHESDLYLSLLKNPIKYPPKIEVDGGWKIHKAPSEKIIALSNGANPSWLNKQLPENILNNLVERLREEYIVVFFGGKDEKKMGKRLEDKYNILNFAGKMGLKESISTMKQCGTLITTDSGLMHCAGAVGMNLVCLWGCTIWDKNRPLGQGKITKVSGDCPKAPCYGKPYMYDCKKNVCMEINVDKIMEVL